MASTLINRFRGQVALQCMVLPWIVWLAIFSYVPMYGILIAFQEYRLGRGFLDGPWVGFGHFLVFFNNPDFLPILRNTVAISLLKLLVGFPAPILFALLLNELRRKSFKKTVQTISYLPYFISWVVISGMIYRLLSSEGSIINEALLRVGIVSKPVFFLGQSRFFWPILVLSDVWKMVGFNSIIFLAAISGIDQTLYEAALADGAGRLRRAFSITLPCLAPTVVILLIFNMSGILSSNFDQIYLLSNPLVMDVAEVIDTYVFKMGIGQARFSFSTAVGLFKSVIGFLLIVSANAVTRRVSEYSIW
jgi:putative aldouronate transport system permease protein